MELEIMDFLGLMVCGAAYLIIMGIMNLKKAKEE